MEEEKKNKKIAVIGGSPRSGKNMALIHALAAECGLNVNQESAEVKKIEEKEVINISHDPTLTRKQRREKERELKKS